jgi:hypothetical protein
MSITPYWSMAFKLACVCVCVWSMVQTTQAGRGVPPRPTLNFIGKGSFMGSIL